MATTPTQITSPRYMLSDDAFTGRQLFHAPTLPLHPCWNAVKTPLCSPLTVLDCPALTLQSSRSLDTLSDLKLQQLEAELEGARHEAQGACQREEELKGECERLKEEMRMLQNQKQRDRVRDAPPHSSGWLVFSDFLRYSSAVHANPISRSTSAGNEFSVQAVRCGVDKEGGRRAVSDPPDRACGRWGQGGGRNG